MKRWFGCASLCVTLLALGCGGGDDNNAADNGAANNNSAEDMSGEPASEDMAAATEDMAAPAEDMGEAIEDMSEPIADMADMGATEEEDMDIPTVGDLGNADSGEDDGCDEAQLLVDQWPLPGGVASTTITSSQADGVWTATVDASAGGFMGASSNPFIYLDLDTGQKVDVGGKPALTGPVEWDMAFRRTAIFINSGDMAAGAIEIARLTGTSFDAVTSADIPADSEFIEEDVIEDGACIVYRPPSGFGTVETVFNRLNMDTNSGSWFSYGMGDLGGVTVIEDHVYILRATDQGKTYKLAFDAWTSGVYELRWAELN